MHEASENYPSNRERQQLFYSEKINYVYLAVEPGLNLPLNYSIYAKINSPGLMFTFADLSSVNAYGHLCKLNYVSKKQSSHKQRRRNTKQHSTKRETLTFPFPDKKT